MRQDRRIGPQASSGRHAQRTQWPSTISKLNTALEFLVLLGVLAIRADLLRDGAWLHALLFAALATIVLSGMHYVATGVRTALRAG